MFYTDDFMMDVMKIDTLPTFLYHYTSIQTLAIILKNKTLRFSRLDQVNDPNEGCACDIKNSNTLVFVSCWTAEEKESIPMWRMYTKNMDGVRIKAPINMFEGRERPVIYNVGGANVLIENMINIERDFPFTQSLRCINGPNKIYYTDDQAFKYPKCMEEEGELLRIIPYDLGMAKGSHWEFESEWRYKICTFGMETILPNIEYTKDTVVNFEKYPILNKYIDVNIDHTTFDEIEICLGPKTTLSDKIILEALLNQYAPRAILKSSELQIR